MRFLIPPAAPKTIKTVVIHGKYFPLKTFSSINQPTIAPAIIEATTEIPILKLSIKTVNKNLNVLSFFSFNLNVFKLVFFKNQLSKIGKINHNIEYI